MLQYFNIMAHVIIIFGITVPTSVMAQESKVTYLFSHGIADNKDQVQKGYTKVNPSNAHPIIDNESNQLETFNYPDAGCGMIYPEIRTWSDLLKFQKNIQKISYRVDRAHTSFAQENEIEMLNQAQASITTPIIGIGVSRGASAFITWLGTHKKEHTIKALVLESPFDSMDSVLRNILGEYLYQYPAARSLGHSLIQFIFSRYKQHGITPYEAAEQVPHDLPILIICSKQDGRVPAWSSEKLAQRLRETGHNNVHCITLSEGVHGKLIQGPQAETYRNAVHAFYQKYDLPHDSAYAEQGRGLI